MALPDFSALTAAQAIAALERLGWTPSATGDWSWVLISPDGAQAARVTPWDDAYRMHAELCVRTPGPHLQRVDAILPLGSLGHVVVMERLWPAPDAVAAAFCAALDVAGDSGWRPPEGVDGGAYAGDPAVASLRARVLALAAQCTPMPFWGGLDVRPGNVMVDAAGTPKLIDPAFVAGRKIVEAIANRDREQLLRLPDGAVAAFLTIPVFSEGPGPLIEAAREMGFLEP
jgi:hypothetical protein